MSEQKPYIYDVANGYGHELKIYQNENGNIVMIGDGHDDFFVEISPLNAARMVSDLEKAISANMQLLESMTKKEGK